MPIVAPVVASIAAITSKASPGFRTPKNAGDHAALAASCQPQLRSARRLPGRSHTSHPETPMTTYSNVHTGAKTQFGGVKGGAVNNGYQVLTASAVTEPPAAPTSRHRPTKPNSAATAPGIGRRSRRVECRKTRPPASKPYQPFIRGHMATTSSPPSTTK